MIELSNGHQLEFLAASGSLAFDGRGWPWEWPLRWIGFIKPQLFTIITKTILLNPWKGNLRWYAPWKVLKFLSQQGEVINPLLAFLRPNLIGGLANAIGLTGPGFKQWLEKDYLTIQHFKYKVIVSIAGEEKECLEMVKRLNELKDIVGIEYNASCPSFNPELLRNHQEVINSFKIITGASEHPVILKLGYSQDYCRIVKETEGFVEAISINAVPWNSIYPDRESPLIEFGGGGVSGKIAQPFTWKMVSTIARETNVPVIGASVWEYEDIQRLKMLGASAYHFGAILLPYPWEPTIFIKRWLFEQQQGR